MTLPSRTRGAGWVALLLLVSAGCSSAEPGQGQASGPQAPGETPFGHVHGLAVNPADDRLYVASHHGVFRRDEDGFHRIADRWQDTMAFTVAGPDHFLASGHPDMREDRPAHLGLVESKDAARSWTALSLEGQADFHALEVAGDRLYGFDSQTGRLMVTEDRRTWDEVIAMPLLDVEADPTDPASLMLTDRNGRLVRLEAGGRPQAVAGAPRLGVLDRPSRDRLVGLGAAGEVWVGDDGGAEWRRAGTVPGAPQALTTGGDAWYAASDRGLFASTDQGRTWEPLDEG